MCLLAFCSQLHTIQIDHASSLTRALTVILTRFTAAQLAFVGIESKSDATYYLHPAYVNGFITPLIFVVPVLSLIVRPDLGMSAVSGWEILGEALIFYVSR